MSENETVMAVCAEWRDCIEAADPSVWNDARISGLVKTTKAQHLAYLDRIEAAWKREKAEWEAAACAFVSDAVMSGKVAVEHAPVGNAAAMREALVKTLDKLQVVTVAEEYDAFLMDDCVRYIMKGLSAPARNCDMLKTGKEAKYRFLQIAELPEGNGDAEMREWYRKLIAWLFEPAKKGEIDGSK